MDDYSNSMTMSPVSTLMLQWPYPLPSIYNYVVTDLNIPSSYELLYPATPDLRIPASHAKKIRIVASKRPISVMH